MAIDTSASLPAKPASRPSLARAGWERVIVIAPGPTLTLEVADTVRERRGQGWRVIAVCNAWWRVPSADVLYASDAKWWDFYEMEIAAHYKGECWTTTSDSVYVDDQKRHRGFVRRLGLNLVEGKISSDFALDGETLSYGDNSGFAAVNLAFQFGAVEVRLAGFDMTGEHFFGEQPKPIADPFNAPAFIAAFEQGARTLPADRRLVLCTPGSRLRNLEVGEL